MSHLNFAPSPLITQQLVFVKTWTFIKHSKSSVIFPPKVLYTFWVVILSFLPKIKVT